MLREGLRSLVGMLGGLAMRAPVWEELWWHSAHSWLFPLCLWAFKTDTHSFLFSSCLHRRKAVHPFIETWQCVWCQLTQGKGPHRWESGFLPFHQSSSPSHKHFLWNWMDRLGFEEILVERFSLKTLIIRRNYASGQTQKHRHFRTLHFNVIIPDHFFYNCWGMNWTRG